MRNAEFSLSVVVPVLNEAESVDAFLAELVPVLEAVAPQWQIIFVDDGSSDRTLPVLQNLAATHPQIAYLSLSRNFGKELALTAGIDHAQGDAVIPMDVDLQDPPALIADMVSLWREGVDVVYATRVRREGDSSTKKLTAAGFYRVMRWISPLRIPENSGDFRLLDRRVVDVLKTLRERNRFMRGLYTWVGFRQASVPFVRAARHVGKTKYGFWRMWNFALEGMTSFSVVPLRLAMYLGLAISVAAFAFAAWIVVKTLVYGRDWPGYASIMVTILFLGGVQLTAIGFIGEYVGRIYNEVKQRPLYVVAQSHGISVHPHGD
ncbi:MAG TPA: glycosyltransferase family 2 protein [Steroidobacteraceae bacterium]|nr:glycosyltransferase family 2 protein [Steroidobacteraceae bacterium]